MNYNLLIKKITNQFLMRIISRSFDCPDLHSRYITKMFCHPQNKDIPIDATLRGTMSQSIRRSSISGFYNCNSIEAYFKYFNKTNLPDLEIISKQHNIFVLDQKRKIYNNMTYVKFYNGTEYKIAEMTFVICLHKFRKNKSLTSRIMLLDSNIMLDQQKIPDQLKQHNDIVII